MKRLRESPGTAVMISHHCPRYTQSVQCFEALDLPPGSKKEHYAAGLDLSKAREALASRLVGDWLFFIDDDHLHTPDLVMRLLTRLDEYPAVDVVSAFVLRRWPPYYTVVGRSNGDGTATVQHIQDGSGLQPVELTGLGGGAVIRRTAFLRVPQPWFTGGRLTEDWTFCERLNAAGGSAAVDLDVQVGHITPVSVWPIREADGSWGVSLVPVPTGTQEWTTDTAKAANSPEPVLV